jgi:hypothetical protein
MNSRINRITIYWDKPSTRSQIRTLLSRVRNLKTPFWLRTNGPHEVLMNILLNLKHGHMYAQNFEVNWFVSGDLRKKTSNFVSEDFEIPALLGPNVEFEKYLDVIHQFKKSFILIPSQWVSPIIEQRLKIDASRIRVWASGVNENFWAPSKARAKRNLILVYVKQESDTQLNFVKNYLESLEIKYKVCKYGNYRPKVFKRLLSKTRAAIWLGGTESQGIALLQAWSMDVPTLVLRNEIYIDPISSNSYTSSSAPYLSASTGKFSESNEIQVSDLEDFLKQTERFEPRKFVLDNFGVVSTGNAIQKLISELSS